MSVKIRTSQKNEKQKTDPLSFLQKDISFKRGWGDQKKLQFYQQLSMLFAARLDLSESLTVVIEGTKGKEKEEIRVLLESLRSGMSLSSTMRGNRNFGDFEVFSVRTGEETGMLDDVFRELQKYYERKIALRKQLMGVLTYPIFILFVSFGVVYFMLTKVVPMFEDVFQQFGAELPDLTKRVIQVSEFASGMAPYLLSLILLGIILHNLFKKRDDYQKIKGKLVTRIPFFGSLIQKIYLARSCQMLYFMGSSRLPLSISLQICSKMITHWELSNALEVIREGLEEGGTLQSLMSVHEVFPKKMIALIGASEKVNRVDKMFGDLARMYQEEVDYESALIGKILEPLLIIVIGVFVAVILIAMYLPLFSLGEVMS